MTTGSTSSHSEPAKFYPPILKTVALLGGSLVFVAIGVWMVSSSGGLIGGIAGIGFFGFCAVVGASRLIRRPVILTIYEDAIEDHRTRIQFEDIDHLVLTSVSGCRFLVIVTREGSPSADEVHAAGITQSMNEAFLPGGSRAMWIPSNSIGISLDQLAEHLGAMVPSEIIRIA